MFFSPPAPMKTVVNLWKFLLASFHMEDSKSKCFPKLKMNFEYNKIIILTLKMWKRSMATMF